MRVEIFVKYFMASERGLVVEFGTTIDEKINARVHLVTEFLNKNKDDLFVSEIIPTYRSLLVIFDPLAISRKSLIEKIDEFISFKQDSFANPDFFKNSNTVEIPVCYGGDFGTDLDNVAEYNNLSEQEVIDIHCQPSYRVYMLGFLPGFCYLGGMDEKIACPRLTSPRTQIPSGSVGIAGSQTGIYPVDSPGGWRLIGKTPLNMFDIKKEQPFLLRPGDTITFKQIDKQEYEKLAKSMVDNND